MNEFKMIDDREEPDEDSYETDPKLFRRLEKQYKLNFKLDAFARDYNKLCDKFLSDALHDEWIPGDIFCDCIFCKIRHYKCDTCRQQYN